jgi:tripeptide aminopeptidase
MMFDYKFTCAERFIRYVQVDTQSNPLSNTFPSTEKQKNLSNILVQELIEMGITDAHLDEYGYVFATIPSNTSKSIPVICFCSHVDTAPDCSGTNVKPIVHKNYQGEKILFPDDESLILSPETDKYLSKKIGTDIITASGSTLLGADDKAGVAIIMDVANFLMLHPEIKHGTIKLLFTPDEEIGKGTSKLDMKKLSADVGYTLDGGELGDFEDETFSADAVTISIHGVIAHPGAAKYKLVNAIKIASEIVDALPKNEWSPETTEKREGFIHPVRIEGLAEKAIIEFIIRDFDTKNLKVHEDKLKNIAEEVLKKYEKATMQFEIIEQYRNMKEILDQHPKVVQYAKEAYLKCGLEIKNEPIRGGTDGSKLSFMGLPCPNIFTGMQSIHSKKEWISVSDMQKSVEVLVTLSSIWEEKTC